MNKTRSYSKAFTFIGLVILLNLSVDAQQIILPSFTDIDGNEYNTTAIGDQIWMAEDLEVTHYPDGSPILHASADTSWEKLRYDFSPGAYCTYNNIVNAQVLYNQHAAASACPTGWHLPTHDEWKEMEITIGIPQFELDLFLPNRGDPHGTELKNTTGWNDYNGASGNGTNNYGFAALPNGMRDREGDFAYNGDQGIWWSASANGTSTFFARSISFNSGSINLETQHQQYGHSVRCIKDNLVSTSIPLVTTLGYSKVMETTATVNGLFSGSLTALDYGFVVSTSSNFASEYTTYIKGTDGRNKAFYANLTGLINNTFYYFKAYASNSNGTCYGETFIFRTGAVPPSTSFVIDVDGNKYRTEKIGNQEWMAQNLKVTHFADSTPIPLVTNNEIWANLADNNIDKAYCIYNNNADNEKIEYGALYSYAAATNGDNSGKNVQGACPTDWHLPNEADWIELENYVQSEGFTGKVGEALKSATGWNPGFNGTDDFLFTTLPGGFRDFDGSFVDLLTNGYWWSSNEYKEDQGWIRHQGESVTTFDRYTASKSYGHSVRCVKNRPSDREPIVKMYTDPGNTVNLYVLCAKQDSSIFIDWGDGALVEYAFPANSGIYITGSPSDTVKIYGGNIKTLKCSFSSLTYLNILNHDSLVSLDCSVNKLKYFDIIGMSKLEHLVANNNNLDSLTVSNCPKLENMILHYNQLVYLNVSNNQFLKGVSAQSNKLSSIIINNVPNLAALNFTDNLLSTLELKNMDSLLVLNLTNNQLTSLNISECPKLRNLFLNINKLKSLDLTTNKNLVYVYCSNNQLTDLKLGEKPSLVSLLAENNRLQNIDLTNSQNLKNLIISQNNLQHLDISNIPTIDILSCHLNSFGFSGLPVLKNKITTFSYQPQKAYQLPLESYHLAEDIDLSSEWSITNFAGEIKTTNYKWFTTTGTELTESVHYYFNEGITTFIQTLEDSVYCEMTNEHFPDLTLKTIAVKISEIGSPNITMYAESSQVVNLYIQCEQEVNTVYVDWGNDSLIPYDVNVSGSEFNVVGFSLDTIKIYGSGIIAMKCYKNNLTYLNVQNADTLLYLDCDSNMLEYLDVSGMKKLRQLIVNYNQLETLIITGCPALKYLEANYNNLSNFTANDNASLFIVNIQKNKLSRVSLSNLPGLVELGLNDNLITSIELNNTNSLKFLKLDNNQLSLLQLSNHPNLAYLTVANNKLSNIDISSCNNITTLSCDSNLLINLDVSSNTKLKELSVNNNHLTSLDISKNKELEILYAGNNQLNNIDISNSPNLLRLNLSNNNLSNIDLISNTQLQYFTCENNYFKFSTFPILYTFSYTYFYYKPQKPIQIPENTFFVNTAIDLSTEWEITNHLGDKKLTRYEWSTKNKELEEGIDYTIDKGITTFLKAFDDSVYCVLLNANYPNLILTTQAIKITNVNNPGITLYSELKNTINLSLRSVNDNTTVFIDFGDGNLQTFLINKNAYSTITGTPSDTIQIYGDGVESFSTKNSELTYLDVKNCKTLAYLNCGSNKLTSLDVSDMPNLEILFADNNLMDALKAPNCPKLKTMDISQNRLSYLDIDNNASLESLDCSVNNMSNLYLYNVPNLISIFFNDNLLNIIELINMDNLKYLNLVNNQLTALNLSECPKLTHLLALNNKLTGIDLTANTELLDLRLGNNNIQSLNLYYAPNLEILQINDNNFNEIDISNNTKLSSFDCSNNSFSFSKFPIENNEFAIFTYHPQRPMPVPGTEFYVNSGIDLSSEWVISNYNGAESTTLYKWFTKGGNQLAEGTDYEISQGVTTFKIAPGDSVYCQMSNAFFSELLLNTENIWVDEKITKMVTYNTPNFYAKVFPNPFSEEVTINICNSLDKEITIDLVNNLGIIVFKRTTEAIESKHEIKISLSDIPQGIYFLRINSNKMVIPVFKE